MMMAMISASAGVSDREFKDGPPREYPLLLMENYAGL
jgi:hypothetical protein